MLWELTKQVITACEDAGVRVKTVISDMGGPNQGMWTAAGIQSTR